MFVVGGVIFFSQHPNPPWKVECGAHYLTWLCVKQSLMAALPKYQNDAERLADLHGVVRLGPTHSSLWKLLKKYLHRTCLTHGNYFKENAIFLSLFSPWDPLCSPPCQQQGNSPGWASTQVSNTGLPPPAFFSDLALGSGRVMLKTLISAFPVTE